MGPKEEVVSSSENGRQANGTNGDCANSCEIFNRLQKYALVSGMADFYQNNIAGHVSKASEFYQDQMNKREWLSKTVNSTAKTLGHVMRTEKLYPIVCRSLSSLDEKACQYMDTLETKTVKEIRTEVVQQSKDKIKMAAFRTGRRAMRTCVGQVALFCLDGSITVTESALHRLCSAFKVRHSPNVIAEAENSPTPPQVGTGTKTLPESTDALTPQSTLRQYLFEAKGRCVRTLRKITIGPLKALAKFLRKIRKMLYKLRGTQLATNEDRIAAIEGRRKVSPRKRIHRTSMRSWMSRVMTLMGVRRTELSLAAYSEDDDKTETSPNVHSKKDKRKHEAMSDEDQDEMSIADDLADYDSADDPDYEPNFNVSSDSLEWATGDTDSDMDTENPDPGHECCELVSLKSKATPEATKDAKEKTGAEMTTVKTEEKVQS